MWVGDVRVQVGDERNGRYPWQNDFMEDSTITTSGDGRLH